MAVLPIGIGSAGGTPAGAVERSLRFNSADSAYLNRTPASAGNRKTWTWSGWVKRSKLGTNYTFLFGVSNSSSNAGYNGLTFGSNGVADTLGFQQWTSTYRTTTQVFRDVGGWLHIVCALDTTQATGANRVKLYVNGSQITVFSTSTDPTQNSDLVVNSNVLHSLGRDIIQSVNFDGYMTEIYFIDGQALTPSSFGETDSETGVWKPKAYSGTYGTNGFYLKFADNSGTTSTTLGKDSSSNGNNWTPNNFSVTAGAGNDSLVDSPTSYGTDTGVGGEVRGNYCTLNPLNKQSNLTLSNGNLDTSSPVVGTWRSVVGTVAMTSGKWYWEATAGANGAANHYFVGIAATSFNALTDNLYIGSTTDTWGYYGANGAKYNNSTGVGYGATYTTNDVIGIAYDADSGTLTFYKNGVSQGTAYTGLTSAMVAGTTGYNGSGMYHNFGQRAFAYTAPSGFKALCTQNLPTPTIGATSTTQANDYFNAVLYTGNGGTQTVSGVGFQPDFVWAKGRSVAYSNRLYDVIRGATKSLVSNNTDGEATLTTQLTAFASDGFTLGSDVGLNQSSATYVAWNWKAGGSNQTISVGQYATSPANVPSIASTVRANTTSGFSIVTYTGNGTNGATIGHGLGSTPKMFITKNRNGYNSSNGFADWSVYHVNSPVYTGGAAIDGTARQALWLHQTAAASNGVGGFPKGPTSTVFTPNQSAYDNASGQTYVAYCFAEIAGFSAFGSYSGNSSADGPFVYTGFRPRYVLIKIASGGSGSWDIHDTARSPYNVMQAQLYADQSAAEASNSVQILDALSNGFKIRGSSGDMNLSGATYIYAAFAEHPFKYSLAR